MNTTLEKTALKKRYSKITMGQGQELFALKKKIKDGHQATEILVKSAKEKARQAVTEAVLVGEALCRVKELLLTSFLKWLKDEVPEVDERTAQKYMRLFRCVTNPNHGSEKYDNLRQAYIALGIITEDTERAGASTSSKQVEQVSRIEPAIAAASAGTPPVPAIQAKAAGIADRPTKVFAEPITAGGDFSPSTPSTQPAAQEAPNATAQLAWINRMAKRLDLDIQTYLQTKGASESLVLEQLLGTCLTLQRD